MPGYLLPPPRTRKVRQGTMYADNYGYTMNFYQPMLDYLDARDKQQTSDNNVALPHLPWSSERGLKQYYPSKPVRQYTNDQLSKLTRECVHRADQTKTEYSTTGRSLFSLIKFADIKHLDRHIAQEPIVERLQKRRLRREQLREKFNKQNVEDILQRIENMELESVQMSQNFKRQIRGKSANQIAQALLSESARNYQLAKQEEENIKAQSIMRASSRGVSRARSSSVEGRISSHVVHLELMDERMVDKLDHRVSSSLHNVKRQLSSLNQKTCEFYADSRCGINKKCDVCRKVLVKYPEIRSFLF